MSPVGVIFREKTGISCITSHKFIGCLSPKRKK